MGGRIITLATEAENLQVAGAAEMAGHPRLGEDAGTVAGCGAIGVSIGDSLEQALLEADLLIDFTFPKVTLENAAVCARLGKGMIVGSTGFTPEEREQLQSYAVQIPIVFAPNMSVGVNVCFKLLKDLAKTLGDGFDVEIVELHQQ